MNRATLIGNLTRDPEQRMTGNGISVCTFSVAVERRFDKEKKADYFSIVAWRWLADTCAKFLHKGSKVFVSGALQNREYEAKDGTKRYVTEIVADEVEFLDRVEHGAKQDEPQYSDADEDLPF